MFLFKRSNGVYYLYYNDTLSGKRRCVSTKSRYKPEALEFLRKFTDEIKPIPKNIYLNDFINEIVSYAYHNLSISSQWHYQNSCKRLLDSIGNKPLKFITVKDIENYKDERTKAVSKTSVNIELRTLKAIFNLAKNWGYTNSNPLLKVKQFSLPEKEKLSFDKSELDLLLCNIPDGVIKNIVCFALHTGCRLNEIVNIQVKDVNFSEGIITIRNKPDFRTKTGRIRQIPISEKLNVLLKSVLKHTGNVLSLINPEMYLYTNSIGMKLSKDFVTKKFKKYLRIAGLPEKYHFHCLRHTFVTGLIKKGVNINYVKELAGHSNIETTMQYVHIGMNDLKEAINKVCI